MELRRTIATLRAIGNLSAVDKHKEASEHIREAKRHIREAGNVIHAQQINSETLEERIGNNVANSEAAMAAECGGEGQNELAIDHEEDEPSLDELNEEEH